MDVDDVALVGVIGEMIAAALVRGTALGDVVLRVNNVTVEPADREDDDDKDMEDMPVPGDYVALTVVGQQGEWRPEVRWRPGAANDSCLLSSELDGAARAAGIPFAYTRSAGTGGSVTVFLPRASGQVGTDRPE